MTDDEIDAALERVLARRPELVESALARLLIRYPDRFRGRDGRDGRDGANASVIMGNSATRTVVTKHDEKGRVKEFERFPIDEG